MFVHVIPTATPPVNTSNISATTKDKVNYMGRVTKKVNLSYSRSLSKVIDIKELSTIA